MQNLNCLQLLREGLPRSEIPRKHIVIVGAGITGLTTALLLKRAGHRITLMESQNRVGGRIYTCRDFPGSMYAEFGAMRYPKQHKLAQHLIHEEFGLSTQPFIINSTNTFAHINGALVKKSEFQSDAFCVYVPGAKGPVTPNCLLRNAMEPLIRLFNSSDHDRAWHELLRIYDEYSLISYLRAQGLSEESLAFMGTMLNLEPRWHFSLVEWFVHYYEDLFSDLEYIVEGSDTLTNSFLPLLSENLRFGYKVTAITQNEGKVSVHYSTPARHVRAMDADECVLTIPCNLLRHLEIEGMDTYKSYAIRNAYYGRAHKIFMQFSRRWWEEDYGITSGVTVTDLAIRNIVYTPAGQDRDSGRGMLLVSYCWEQDSMPYSSLSEEEQIREALEDLCKIHPEAAETFEHGAVYDWSQDAHAGGIGPLFRPHEMSGKTYYDLIRPINRVWFANDACDRQYRRWVEGSLKAAVKNAHAINSGIRNQMPWAD